MEEDLKEKNEKDIEERKIFECKADGKKKQSVTDPLWSRKQATGSGKKGTSEKASNRKL